VRERKYRMSTWKETDAQKRKREEGKGVGSKPVCQKKGDTPPLIKPVGGPQTWGKDRKGCRVGKSKNDPARWETDLRGNVLRRAIGKLL